MGWHHAELENRAWRQRQSPSLHAKRVKIDDRHGRDLQLDLELMYRLRPMPKAGIPGRIGGNNARRAAALLHLRNNQAKQPMPIHTIAHDRVKPAGVAKVKQAIAEFVPDIRANAPGTRITSPGTRRTIQPLRAFLCF
jgi:hypothetical protein